ncbi:MAG: diacylglycerol kinase family protein [Velocimicrobium sp.]
MYYFIINPTSKSGLGKHLWYDLKTEMDQHKIAYQYYFTKRQFHATKLIEEILQLNGEKHIIIVGGDGTLNEAANGFHSYENASISFIPSGSGNDFAKGIHLSKNPMYLLTSILTSDTPSHYDQGLCHVSSTKSAPNSLNSNERKFLISAGIGFDASICYEALNSKIKNFLNKIKLGKLTYVLIALKQVINYTLTDAQVQIDGVITKNYPRIFFIAAMNQPFEGGGFKMAPRAVATDGKLSIAVFYNMSKLKAILILPLVIFGMHTHAKGFETFDCETIDIKTNVPLVVHTDGEYAGLTDHLTFSILPEQITYLR